MGQLGSTLIKKFCLGLIFPALICLSLLFSAGADPLGTHSFTSSTQGTHPFTLNYSNDTITVDLSTINGATVYRAIFDPNREYFNSGGWPSSTYAMENIIIQSSDGTPLEILPPRYLTFDATTAVQDALAQGGTQLVLTVSTRAGLAQSNETLSLEIMCDRPLPSSVEQVSNAAAMHRDGDTMITFQEVNSPLTNEDVSCETFNTVEGLLDDTEKIRYRIYRSPNPIETRTDLLNAELIDEIPPLSCWNARYYGRDNCNGELAVPRFPIDDLTIAPPGTGIYVHRHAEGQSNQAFYFISHSVDGAEDFSTLSIGTNVTVPVLEDTGPGMVLERSVETPDSFRYVNNPTLHYYVRWECPPTHNLPSEPYNYLVAEPRDEDAVFPAPVDVALHCWGGSLNGGYGWWYRAEEGGIMVSTNQYPYDWWTAYHENYRTLKSFEDGTVQPYNQVRILSFLYDFVAERFDIDTERLLLSGSSMGGSGASMWGMRSGHIFSHIISWVGIHTPSLSPHFLSSFENMFGKEEWNTTYSNSGLERFGYEIIDPSDNVSAFDYWDTTQWILDHPDVETPWISFANGKNDSAIGWPQAHAYVNALQKTHRPFNFAWGQSGHSTRAQLIDGTDRYCGLDFTKNQVQPIFQNCSLDDDLGDTPEAGDDQGRINRYFSWDPSSIVETADQLEMSAWLIDDAPDDSCTVDIGFRRLTDFTIAQTDYFYYEVFDAGDAVISTGYTTADDMGLLSLKQLTISRGEGANRIVLTKQTALSFDTDADQDVDGLDLVLFALDMAAGQSQNEDIIQFSAEYGTGVQL